LRFISGFKKIETSPETRQPVIKLMSAATQLDSAKKVCVLSFDEMKIRKSNCYDRASDSNLHPVNYVQVAMLRGKNYIFYYLLLFI